jgi:hypothetical protein
MSLKQQQIQRELEAVQLAAKESSEFKLVVNLVREIFQEEINLLAETIPKWWQGRRLKNGEHEKPSDEEIYRRELASIDMQVLAETIIRALFEATMINSTHTTDYQQVVSVGLIDRRLRSLIGSEKDKLIHKKDKFQPVDFLVNKTVRLFNQKLFTEKQTTRRNSANGNLEIFYAIGLTESAITRLGGIPAHTIIIDSPMFCKPEPWTSVFSGGFLTPEAQRGNPLVQSFRLDGRDLREIDKSLQASEEILPAINKMQSVGFRLDPKYQDYQNSIKIVRKKKISKCDKEITKLNKKLRELFDELETLNNDSL